MYRKIEDFKKDWTMEAGMTEKIFKAVSEDKKREKLNENVRSLERLAWHITQTLAEMPCRAGLLEQDQLEHAPIPPTMQDIISVYQDCSNRILEAVDRKWNDASLEEEVEMYGEKWKKGIVLSILIRHQTHHRAQMTTLMRWLGLQVPGVYGPSKEEWKQMGMQPME